MQIVVSYLKVLMVEDERKPEAATLKGAEFSSQVPVC